MIRLIRWLVEKRLRRMEYALGISFAYLRHMLRVAPFHFFRFVTIMPLARYRRILPAEVYHVARIITARYGACGSCLQMELRLAKQAGVDAAVLNTVLDGNPCALPPDLAAVYFFAEALATHADEADTYREAILRRYGEIGLIELSMAIAVCRVFPTLKQAMGCAVPHVPSNTQFGALDH